MTLEMFDELVILTGNPVTTSLQIIVQVYTLILVSICLCPIELRFDEEFTSPVSILFMLVMLF